MNAPRKMVAVSMSASIRLGATAVNAGVALCCTRTNMTVKKVFHLHSCTFLVASDWTDKSLAYVYSAGLLLFAWYRCPYLLSDVFLQLDAIRLWIAWVAPSPVPTGQINTRARRHAPGHSPPLLAIASKLYVLLPTARCVISLVNRVFMYM